MLHPQIPHLLPVTLYSSFGIGCATSLTKGITCCWTARHKRGMVDSRSETEMGVMMIMTASDTVLMIMELNNTEFIV